MVARSYRATLALFRQNEWSPAAAARHLADAVDTQRDAYIAQGIASPRFVTYVDGVLGADENTVRDVILVEFQYLGEIVQFVLGFLQGACPVDTGRYRSSFWVAVNGSAVPATAFDPTSIPLNSTVVIYNSQPYSRKVDSHLIGTKPLNYAGPQWLFENAAAAGRRRFGNRASIVRTYNVDFPGKYRLRVEQSRKRKDGTRSRTARAIGTPVESPGIVLKAL